MLLAPAAAFRTVPAAPSVMTGDVPPVLLALPRWPGSYAGRTGRTGR